MNEIIEFLNKKQIELDSISTEGNWYDLQYTVNSNVINIECGWNSYEEDDNSNIKITVENSLLYIEVNQNGHCCMSGDFSSDDVDCIDISTFETWFNENINL